MFLPTIEGRYWVELIDQATADWEGFRMDHAVAKYYRQSMLDRTASPRGSLADARFFSLRDRNADPVSTAMVLRRKIEIGVGRSNRSPFPQYKQDYQILAKHLGVSFNTNCYPYGPST